MMTPDTEKMLKMLQLQIEANAAVSPDWREQGWPWSRAIWTECAELLELLDWKWWKNAPVNKATEVRIQGEVVDILHFLLSALLQHGYDERENNLLLLAETIMSCTGLTQKRTTPIDYSGQAADAVERFVGLVFYHAKLNGSLPPNHQLISAFFMVCFTLDITIDDLFIKYAGKNCLNKLRQKHGYNEGLYHREWEGVDDNDHLSVIQAGIKNPHLLTPDDYCTEVSAELELTYLELCSSWAREK